jgi:hypothetical protein
VIWVAVLVAAPLMVACSKSDSSSPGSPAPVPTTSTFTVTFTDNPVPYRTSGCNGSTPQGWYTNARIQETSGVAFTPSSLTQKLDGSTNSSLAESFWSRFGACSGSTLTPGVIPGNGGVCGVVGICTTGTYGNYQFEFSGTDANGHAVTQASPILPFSAK